MGNPDPGLHWEVRFTCHSNPEEFDCSLALTACERLIQCVLCEVKAETANTSLAGTEALSAVPILRETPSNLVLDCPQVLQFIVVDSA